MPRRHDTLEEKQIKAFWAKVNKNGPIHPIHGQCWEWTAAVFKGYRQYGQCRVVGESRSHRASYKISIGGIPTGLQVLHKCDNPICVNPERLFVGTHQDNMTDMVNKQRQAVGDRQGGRLHPESRPRGDDHGFRKHPEAVPRGEWSGKAKLTEKKVARIRRLFKLGKRIVYLARLFTMSKSAIGSVVHRETWKHVKEQA